VPFSNGAELVESGQDGIGHVRIELPRALTGDDVARRVKGQAILVYPL